MQSEITTTKEFVFEINRAVIQFQEIANSDKVTITFTDNALSGVDIHTNRTLPARAKWALNGAINEMISDIEIKLKGKNN